MDLTVETETRADHVVVTVAGELDLGAAAALRDHLAATLHSTDHLVLDLRGVRFIDSTGLKALVATRRRANLGGERFSLRLVAQGPVSRLLELTGLAQAFDIDSAGAD
jgi:anti-sigma B factor antagonist